MDPKTKAAAGGNAKKKKQRSPAAKFIFTVLKILIVFFIALSFAIIGIVGGAIYGYIKTTPPITDEQLQIKNFTSFIYDSKGNEITKLNGSENRVWIDDKNIPKNLKNAFVALEDERFYEHRGIDPKRIIGVTINLFKKGKVQGGASTITQQVVRNLTDDRKVTLQRKVQEQWRAIKLESKLEKWQILELYMNLIYMGHNCYGVQTAAKLYFNKSVQELDLAESASLAGITNSPGLFDPFTTKGRENNKKRQMICLGLMLKQGYISQAEYDQAAGEELQFVEGDTSELKKTSTQPYFVDQVINDIMKDLKAQGMSEQIALKSIYNNGYKIYTTMDSDVQRAVDDTFKDEKLFPKADLNGIVKLINNYKSRSDYSSSKKLQDLVKQLETARNVISNDHPQAGMAIIDPKTGQVKAMYGGFGEKKGNTLNRATQIKRQTGSSMKPIAIYGPAVDQRLITPATIVDDVPVHFDTNDKSSLYPMNDDNSFRGLTNIRDAIAQSVNVVAAKLYMEYPDLPYEYLKKVGINRDKERYLSLALGGLKEGLNPLQMAAAYVPFDNKGMYIEPITYTKVVDRDGKVIIEKKPKSNIVYNETTAFVMTSMMESVVKYGTAAPYGVIKNSKGEVVPTAGKTGTTDNQTDRWFVGYSPYYVGAVWYGYDTPVRLEGMYNKNPALQIWRTVMTKIHSDLPATPFIEPPGITRKTVCIYSGKTPTDLCEKDPRNSTRGSIRYNEVFIKGTEPKDDDKCDIHVLAKVDKDSKDMFGRPLLAGPNCPPASIEERVFIQRKEEYKPLQPNDPYPSDWQYELPAGEYCNIHGAGAADNNAAGTGTELTGAETPGADGTTGTPQNTGNTQGPDNTGTGTNNNNTNSSSITNNNTNTGSGNTNTTTGGTGNKQAPNNSNTGAGTNGPAGGNKDNTAKPAAP